MARRDTFIFSVDKWRTDMRVRSLTLSARGAFFDILCAFHACRGKTIDTAMLARLIRVPLNELQPELDMLEEYGLLHVRDGIVCVHNRFKAKRESLPPSVRREVLADGPCKACGSSDDLEVDHIIPLSRGGWDTIDNLQPLCFRCNRSKATQTMDEFMAGRAC